MRKISVFLTILLVQMALTAQKTVSRPNNDKVICNCGTASNYAPDPKNMNFYPTKYVRVNVHFIDAKDTTLNFSEETGREYARMLIEGCNERLEHNLKMNIPANNDLPALPINFRYVISPFNSDDPEDDGIYFHQDDYLCYYNKTHSSRDYSLFSDKQFETYKKCGDEVLNIFLLEHHPDSIASPTYKTSADGVGKPHWVKIANSYHHYINNANQNLAETVGSIARLMNHEIGHSLGLAHTWSMEDGCPDTPKNRNCWYIDPADPGCDEWGEVSNNVMDYNAFQQAYTPCQLAKINYNFYREGAPQGKNLLNTWCSYKSDKKVIIEAGNEVDWCDIKYLEGDIIIEKDAFLTLHCKLSLPKGAQIYILPGGKLFLDNGSEITNICGDEWTGVTLFHTKKQKAVFEKTANSDLTHFANETKEIFLEKRALRKMLKELIH